ncbi:MAG TPA: GNAT family protein [Nocardioidaceae bacterium]|nr:GNAT family protein [Nocardioidaceae bacterium]
MTWQGMTDAQDYADQLLEGARMRLRATREDDLGHIESWWADPATAVLQAGVIRPQPPGAMAGLLREWSANKDNTAVGFSVETRDERELVGHVALFAITPARGATLGIVLAPERTSRGYGTDAMRLLLRYGFDELGLHRIGLQVWAFNDRARATYRALGFREEGRRRDVLFHAGRFHDEVQMGLLEEEWRPTAG